MRKIKTVIVALAVLSLAVLSLGLTGKSRNTGAGNPAVDVSSFFDGATVRLIVPHAPGGGYDLYARLLAPYLAKYSGRNNFV